ncbi:MAG TPA: hypothetical protein VFZ32_19905 [Micromonosporaceae bacterium]
MVDGAGRLLASREVDDTPIGYATLLSLISERCADTGQVRAAIATDSETNLVPLLLAAAGDPLAVGDAGTVAQFVSDEPPGTPEPHRRALALARALQSGVLPATTQPAPRDLATLRPVLTAHRAAVIGRGAAVGMLRGLLRELYPAALRTFPDPGTPLALAVLERLASPAEVDGIRDGDVLSQLRAAGHPGAEADTAIAALRRAVAEMSTRTGSSDAVAATIRDGVVTVRATESAAAGLVNVIVERVEPRTSGRGFMAVPAVSGPPVSGVQLPTLPVSGPPTSGVPAVGSRTSASPALPAQVAGLPTSEHPQTPQRFPGGRSLPTRDTSIAAAFGPPSSTPPRSAPPVTGPQPFQTSPATPQRPPARQAPAVPPPVPSSRHQAAAARQEHQTGGYPATGPDRSDPLGSPGIGSAVSGPATRDLPRAGLPTSGFPAAGRNLNGTVPPGAANSGRYRENSSPQPPTGPLAPPTGSAAPAQSDAELSLLSPDELPGGPDQRRSAEPTSRYTDPTSGRLAALIEFPGSARRQAPPPPQGNRSYREQPGHDTEDEVTREHRTPNPRREPPPRNPAPSPPLNEADGDLLIFAQARSAWFSDPEEESDQEPEWRSEADAGWDAAAAASHPTVGGTTISGLPRRVPSANLVPGTVTNRELVSTQPINRDAAQLAAHTAGYFRGWNRARQDVEEPPYPSARHR